MSTTQIVLLIIVIVAVVAIAVVGGIMMRRRALRQRFGPEYDRVLSEEKSRSAGERELRDRERRHSQLEIRPLSKESREWFTQEWEEIQTRFVDEPNEAVGAADELVTRLVRERGYPTDNYDEQVAQLSVEHARTLHNYREAHEINERNQRGEASTEELRQAVVHYRALFAELLETPQDAQSR